MDTHATTLKENFCLYLLVLVDLQSLFFYEQTAVEYSNSRKRTAQLAPLIKNQNKQYTTNKTQIKITKQAIKKEKKGQYHTSYQSNIFEMQFAYGMNGAL